MAFITAIGFGYGQFPYVGHITSAIGFGYGQLPYVDDRMNKRKRNDDPEGVCCTQKYHLPVTQQHTCHWMSLDVNGCQ